MKTLFIHSTSDSGYKFTLAGEVYEDHIRVGLAKCGKKDNFNKKLGRTISKGRIKKNKCRVWGFNSNDPVKRMREIALEYSKEL